MNELTIEQAQLAELREILRQFDASCAKGSMGDSGDILLQLEEWGPVSIARLAVALDAQLQQERARQEKLRNALEGLMHFADRVLYSFNGDLSRHKRWEEASAAARAALAQQSGEAL